MVDWHGQLVEQLDWHWREHARPRLDGLTDEEYRWEPVEDCWNVRPRGTGTAPIQAGSGEFTCDFAVPEPDPAPVTTIAWRLAHITVGIFGDGQRVTSAVRPSTTRRTTIPGPPMPLYAISMPRTRPGATAFGRSTPMGWPDRSDPPRGRGTRARWPI